MFREIKFRAWKDGKMHYDPLITFNGGEAYALSCPGGDIVGANYSFSVMQYTGLKDKNGKEIYEGDVIAIYSFCKKKKEVSVQGEVKWGVFNIGCNGFEYDMNVVGPYVEDEYLYGEMILGLVVVIGNTYENPELLKESQDV